MSEVTKAPEAPKIDIARLAEACATNPQAYQDFVVNLTSPAPTYNLGAPAVMGLVEALERLNPASLELDHFKRVITYGEKQRINPAARLSHFLGSPDDIACMESHLGYEPAGEEGMLTPEQVKRRLLIHGILGKMTEALELAPLLIQLLLPSGKCDEVNLREELGDDDFYTILIHFALGIDQRVVRHTNVMKLGKRYKGGVFTVDEAIRRNLEEERAELERSMEGK